MASDKSELARLNKELGEIYDKITSIIDRHPSIMIYSGTGKEAFGESSSAICETFSMRLDYFRRQLKKINDQVPSNRKKPIKWKE